MYFRFLLKIVKHGVFPLPKTNMEPQDDGFFIGISSLWGVSPIKKVAIFPAIAILVFWMSKACWIQKRQPKMNHGNPAVSPRD